MPLHDLHTQKNELLEIDTDNPSVREWAGQVQTPALLLDLGALRRRLALLMEESRCTVMYALKANPHEALLRDVMMAGGGFDVASEGELRLMQELGVSGERIFFSSIAKTMKELSLARALNVRLLSADSRLELEKICELYPKARVLIRMWIKEPSAGVPLSNRFGVHGEQLADLIWYGRELGLRIEGLSLHVGSQCMNRDAWAAAVRMLRPFLDPAMKCVALGGGFPIAYRAFDRVQIPTLSEIAASVAVAVGPLIDSGLEVLIEPGRALAGPVGTLVTTVNLLKPSMNGRKWLFLDVGAYNALQIVCEGFDFYLRPLEESRKHEEYDICGPSCHSRDVFNEPITLPAQMPGDRILVMNAGAYTIPFITPFCGNPQPRVDIFEACERGFGSIFVPRRNIRSREPWALATSV